MAEPTLFDLFDCGFWDRIKAKPDPILCIRWENDKQSPADKLYVKLSRALSVLDSWSTGKSDNQTATLSGDNWLSLCSPSVCAPYSTFPTEPSCGQNDLALIGIWRDLSNFSNRIITETVKNSPSIKTPKHHKISIEFTEYFDNLLNIRPKWHSIRYANLRFLEYHPALEYEEDLFERFLVQISGFKIGDDKELFVSAADLAKKYVTLALRNAQKCVSKPRLLPKRFARFKGHKGVFRMIIRLCSGNHLFLQLLQTAERGCAAIMFVSQLATEGILNADRSNQPAFA